MLSSWKLNNYTVQWYCKNITNERIIFIHLTLIQGLCRRPVFLVEFMIRYHIKYQMTSHEREGFTMNVFVNKGFFSLRHDIAVIRRYVFNAVVISKWYESWLLFVVFNFSMDSRINVCRYRILIYFTELLEAHLHIFLNTPRYCFPWIFCLIRFEILVRNCIDKYVRLHIQWCCLYAPKSGMFNHYD